MESYHEIRDKVQEDLTNIDLKHVTGHQEHYRNLRIKGV